MVQVFQSLSIKYAVMSYENKDLGKVLAGIQVPPADDEAFNTFLEKLNYTYVEETDNAVYRRYLRG